MTLRFTALLALLFCVGVFGIAATINQFAIVDAVNAKLPADDQFDQSGWFLPKTLELHRKYRRLYPDGGLVQRQGILAATVLFCIVVAAVLIGFGPLGVAWLAGVGAVSLWLVYFRKSTTG
jgi:hypothetical protein